MSIQINNTDVIDDGKNIVNAVNSNISGISTAVTGCVTGTFTGATVCGGTVCATTGFSGSGANLTNIPSGAITGSLGGIRVCTYSSPGTFPVPPGTTTLKITAIGGGGNGGFAPAAGPVFYRPGGGGAGAAGVKYLTVPPSCSSYPVTIGGAGGDTIFGGPTVFLLEGGCTGCASGFNFVGDGGWQGNRGCTPSTATYLINNPSQAADCSCSLTNAQKGAIGNAFQQGGYGQSSHFGTGGGCCYKNAQGYGAGGQSGYNAPTVDPAGTGSPGFMIVEW